MRILVRTSKWAVWARRFGALALPLAVLPVLLHREHIITSENFIAVEAVALALAALAVAMALVAFVRLWFTGDQGWGRAALALIFGMLCLGPAAWFGWLALHDPDSPDVSTDFTNPPPLVSFVESRFIGPDERQRIEATFPNARSRSYPIAAPQMFDVVAGLVDDRGWEPRARRAPQTSLDAGQLNVVVTTLLGFRQEVAIRVAGGNDGATVAMRSASLSSFPDFGENGQRVEAFLLDLDNQVTLMLRDAPAAPQADN
ncbi:MAG: DUF1499 domain-containing protein [Devosia nanyangense]|uniref:DUF1499 domain-containing protein n=1 Tax=Devosia nanyangense TaxID=1228055 RepID=A0A933L1E8_9HYPH|nr:DUF1499 domain-containing protein [Devosia nanyangense]